MKKIKYLFAVLFLIAAMFSCNKSSNEILPTDKGGGGKDLTPITITCPTDGTPVLVQDWQSGDAAYECGRIGDCHEFAYKIEKSGTYPDAGTYYGPPSGDNKIEIEYVVPGKTFSWTSEYPVCKVIVKAGTEAHIYCYENAYTSGTVTLEAPTNTSNGTIRDISHITFCYDDPDVCYEEETAWAIGERYVSKGSWAMYAEYSEGGTIDLRADGGDGVGTIAGTVSFSAVVGGMVTINVNLTGGAIFYYDLLDPLYDNNLKVQDYSSKPNKTPNPGGFAWKSRIEPGLTTGTIVVPANNFYGIHLDVALPVACP